MKNNKVSEKVTEQPKKQATVKATEKVTESKPTTKAPKTKKPEVIVEDVSDNEESEIEVTDSDDSDLGSDIDLDLKVNLKTVLDLVNNLPSDSEDDADSDSEDEDASESTSDPTETKEPVAKEVKQKPTFDGCFSEIDTINKEELKLDAEINELHKSLDFKLKQKKALQKQRNKIFNLLPKSYEDGCNKARKEKKKRTNASRSGILKESPIPPILIKFLELQEGTLLSRPKVFSLLNNKFKELGLKKGQDTFLDKKTAKLFGLEEGHKIEFKMCQTFLAELYNAEKAKSTEVSL